MTSTLTVALNTPDPSRPDYLHLSRGSIQIRNPALYAPADKALLAAVGPTTARCFLRWQWLTGAPGWQPGNPLDYTANPNFSLTNQWLDPANWANGEELVITQEGLIHMPWAGTVNAAWVANAGNRQIYEDLQFTAFRHYKILNPAMKWVGCLNEPNITPNGQFSGLNIYRLLKTTVEAVIRVNALGLAGPPLRVLGPETTFNFVEPQNATGNDNSVDFVNAIVADAAWWNTTGKPNMGGLSLHSFNNSRVVNRLIGIDPNRGFAKFDALAAASTLPAMFDGIPRIVTAFSREDNGADGDQSLTDGKGWDQLPSTLMMAQQAAFYAAWHELAHRYRSPAGDRLEDAIMFSRSNYVDYSNSMVRPFNLPARFPISWVPGARTPVYNVAALEARIANNTSEGLRWQVTGTGPEWGNSTVNTTSGQVMTATAVTRPGVGKVWLLVTRVSGGANTTAAAIRVDWQNLSTHLNTAQPITVDAWLIDRDNSILNPSTGTNGDLQRIVNSVPLVIPGVGLPRTTLQMQDPAVVLIELTGTPTSAPPGPPPPVDPPPDVTITGPTQLLVGQTATFQAVNTGGPTTSRTWATTGSPTPATGTGGQFATTWAAPGSYTVTVTAVGPGGTDQATQAITVTQLATTTGGIVVTGPHANLGIRHGTLHDPVGYRDMTFQLHPGAWSQAFVDFLEKGQGNRLPMTQAQAYVTPNGGRRWLREYAASLPGPSDRIKAAINVQGLAKQGIATIADLIVSDATVNATPPRNGQQAGLDSHLPTDPVTTDSGLYFVRETFAALGELQDNHRVDVYASILHEMNGNWFLHGWNKASHTDFLRLYTWMAREAHHVGLPTTWAISIGPAIDRGIPDNLTRFPLGLPDPVTGARTVRADPHTGQRIVDVISLNHYNKAASNRSDQVLFNTLVEMTSLAEELGIQFALEEWAAGGQEGIQHLADTHAHIDSLPPPPGVGSLAYTAYFNPAQGGPAPAGGGTDETYYDVTRTPGRTAFPLRAQLVSDIWGWLHSGRPGPAPWEDLTPYGIPGGSARCIDCGTPPPPPTPPLVTITGPTTASVGDTLTYTAVNSGGPAVIQWQASDDTGIEIPGTGTAITVTFTAAGSWTIAASAENDGGTSSDTVTVTVAPRSREGAGGRYHMLI